MTGADALILAVAGFLAGVVNGVAGGGSLVSYPALLATGHGALVANVTNTVGILPGYLGGAAGFRDVLASQRVRIRELAPFALAGGLIGSLLLLATSERLFENLAPVLILGACALFAAQPRLNRAVSRRRHDADDLTGPVPRAASIGVFAASVYGGYFGAGIGVIFLAILGTVLIDPLPRINALRGILSLLVNLVAVVVFCIAADVAWDAVAVLGVTSLVGGYVGARASLRLPVPVLRAVVLLFGLLATARLLLT